MEEIEEHNIVGATCLAMTRAMKMASSEWWPLATGGEIFLELFEKKNEIKKLVSSGDGRPHEKIAIPTQWIGKRGYQITRHCHGVYARQGDP